MKLLTIELLETLQRDYDKLNSKKEKTKAREIMSTIIRKYCDLLPVTFISDAAKKEAIDINLFKMNWNDQKKFDRRRSVFHLEHKTTVRDTVKYILEGTHPKSAIENMEFGWILKKEDKLLSVKGFRSHRLEHDKAYEKCGINIISASLKSH
jgi:hypothetical protein